MVSNPLQITAHGLSSAESLQQLHYESIASGYDEHYNDEFSRRYMLDFAFEPMFAGIDLNGKRVLEAMCGGGQTAGYLHERNAHVTGLDISAQQTRSFSRRNPEASVLCSSILASGIADESFDVVSIVGGIHHMPPHVDECLREIHRILKPGGYLCFMEPHSESIAEGFRRFWYKHDPLFAKNEAAINIGELHREFQGQFAMAGEKYMGNFGYLFVLNSMVFRIPVRLKKFYSPLMLGLEKVLNRVLGKPFSCFVVGQWQKI
jgi:SAM-dependent methyltransferase